MRQEIPQLDESGMGPRRQWFGENLARNFSQLLSLSKVKQAGHPYRHRSWRVA